MRMPAMLPTCQEVQDFLMDFLDGRLRLVESLRFRGHLLFCAPCKHYIERYKDGVALSRNILNDPPPPELVNLTQEFLKNNLPRK